MMERKDVVAVLMDRQLVIQVIAVVINAMTEGFIRVLKVVEARKKRKKALKRCP